jgi:hypothetical protein
MEWIFYAAPPTLVHMYQHWVQFLPLGPTRLGDASRHAQTRAPRRQKPGRAGWIPAMFLLEAAAVILTLLTVRYMVAETGDDRPMAVWAAAVWTTLLVGITIRTVFAWRG